ncbi:helix-turn-helix domain-containing protein [Streptomyces sp. NPDC086777]|uniref:PucR family transcriptional regulator n=1 Tax=Streptomyces sp. NPDC086777 TaxID=3154866 RepID=UPI00344DE689
MALHTPSGDFAGSDSTAPAAHEWTSTLATLLTQAGQSLLHQACAPRGVDGRVSGAVVHDMGERVPPQADGILLAVGGSPARADTLDAIRQAGAEGYRAVVLKARGEDYSAAVYEANAAGVCLLITPDDVAWQHLDTVIAAVAAVARHLGPHGSRPDDDLFGLTNEIACAVGGATVLEDPSGRVLAHSTLTHQETDQARRQTILRRRACFGAADEDAYDLVRRAHGVVRISPAKALHSDRLAVAVRAGGKVLGLLWVLDQDSALSPAAEEALRDAAPTVALRLARQREFRTSSYHSRATTLTALLEDRISEQAAAEQLGLDRDMTTTVVAVTRYAGGYSHGAGDDRIADVVRMYGEALHSRAVCAMSGGTLYLLVPAADAGGPTPERLRRTAHDMALAVHRSTESAVHVGIAGPMAGLGEVPACRRIADLVLEATAPDTGDVAVASADDVHSRIALIELLRRGAAEMSLPADPVQRILAYDQRHSTTYAETLLAYLDSFGEAARAAAMISVHENTLRYRMKRIQELFGLDLSDAQTRLVTWLRLHLGQMSSVHTARPARPSAVSPFPALD